MVRAPTKRRPTHPGEMLLQEFLLLMDLTQRELADAVHVPYQRLSEIVNGRRGITPSTALRLAKFFGNSAGFWSSKCAGTCTGRSKPKVTLSRVSNLTGCTHTDGVAAALESGLKADADTPGFRYWTRASLKQAETRR